MSDSRTVDVEKLAKLEAAATPGEWLVGGPYPGTSVCVCVDPGVMSGPDAEPPHWEPVCILDQRTEGAPNPQAQAAAAFIAESRNQMPALLRELSALRQRVGELDAERLRLSNVLGYCRTDVPLAELVDSVQMRLEVRGRPTLMEEAIERYLELCRAGGGGVCDCGKHADDCPLVDRPCLPHDGGLCHWCQLDAASMGIDYRTVEAEYDSKQSEPADATDEPDHLAAARQAGEGR
jgi:hypothetical protein